LLIGDLRRRGPVCHEGELEVSAGESAARIGAVQVALHDLINDRPEEAVLSLETALILREEAVEVMKRHPVEGSPLRMSGAVGSGHSGTLDSRDGPKPSS